MPLELEHWSMHSHSALFCEVRVNAVTGEIRVSRFLGSFDCGRILNAKTAASQFRGGIIMGLGLALMEEALFDERTGRIMNPTLAEYHVPVHLDVPEIDVIWTDEPDPHAPWALAASARSALRASAPRSPTLCSTPRASACAIFRSRSTRCCKRDSWAGRARRSAGLVSRAGCSGSFAGPGSLSTSPQTRAR